MVPQHPRQAQRPSLSWTACSGRRTSERHSARVRQPVPMPARRRGARTLPGALAGEVRMVPQHPRQAQRPSLSWTACSGRMTSERHSARVRQPVPMPARRRGARTLPGALAGEVRMVPQHPRQAQRPSLSWTACSGRRTSERHSARVRQPVPMPARRRGARTLPGALAGEVRMVPQHPRQAQRPSLSWTACSGRRISERHSARERQPVPMPARRRGARTSPGRWQERCAWCPSTRDRLSAHRSAGLLAQAGGHLSGTLRASGSQCRCQPGAGERAPARGAGRRGAHGAPAPATGSAPIAQLDCLLRQEDI